MKNPQRTQAILWQQWATDDRAPRSIEDVLTDEDRARIDAERILEEDDEDLDIEWDDEENDASN
jgi:hypothetical protein